MCATLQLRRRCAGDTRNDRGLCAGRWWCAAVVMFCLGVGTASGQRFEKARPTGRPTIKWLEAHELSQGAQEEQTLAVRETGVGDGAAIAAGEPAAGAVDGGGVATSAPRPRIEVGRPRSELGFERMLGPPPPDPPGIIPLESPPGEHAELSDEDFIRIGMAVVRTVGQEPP